MTELSRDKRIYKVTLLGSLVNILLLVMKFVAGILGNSAAMIADAVHSLSDFATDIVVLAFVKLSSRPADEQHNYGHGKYETVATTIIGLSLLVVAIGIAWNGCEKVMAWHKGIPQESPGLIALIIAVVSILAKEWIYHVTMYVAKDVDSPALEANAWHHRSDAFSSVGTALGIGGAVILGNGWEVLDAIAAIVVSILLFISSLRLLSVTSGELLEHSLPEETVEKIKAIVCEDDKVRDIHNLKTRRIGHIIAIEMHLRLPGEISLEETHQHTRQIKRRLWNEFGKETFIIIQVEPIR